MPNPPSPKVKGSDPFSFKSVKVTKEVQDEEKTSVIPTVSKLKSVKAVAKKKALKIT